MSHQYILHTPSRSKTTKIKILVTKFAYRIDGEGHIDGIAKVSDLYTSSNVGSNGQSSKLVVLKVIFSDVAITTNEEAIVEEEVEDNAMISRAPVKKGAGEANGGSGNSVKRVKLNVIRLEGICHKLGSNIGKNGLSIEGL